VEAIFPLDADNLLSPHTLATLWDLLEARPEAGWAFPTLELFGAEDGVWYVPGPFLSYRQLFENQPDAGSLIRRAVFDAGIAFDETLLDGYEDWELFLNAALAGFRGAPAGRCGFRYRRRAHSLLARAQQRRADPGRPALASSRSLCPPGTHPPRARRGPALRAGALRAWRRAPHCEL